MQRRMDLEVGGGVAAPLWCTAAKCDASRRDEREKGECEEEREKVGPSCDGGTLTMVEGRWVIGVLTRQVGLASHKGWQMVVIVFEPRSRGERGK